MKKLDIDITLPELPTDEEVHDDVKNAPTDDIVFTDLADKLASARGGEAPGAEAVFLQAHRLLSTCDKLRHGARHVTAQLELLQRERARLALLVSDARGHAAAGER
ncbi:uncharacterized protein LOC122384917 [Amphibalanus amphitrite]|uniref:uncharacterized protein LOC122380849 n=1 Tax=Amphibalanus amphitrite TaxID=1232801 RepID=UPI001C91D6A7|nr:uncharacterized protein LOC122380849 [Amphibalanus amphitrite]XP_043228685.1 uncharacterized protein LOC122384917 [Amphibalanus amphitrite]